MPPILSVGLSSANGTETPIAATDNVLFYEDAIRLVKFYFRVVFILTVDLTWLVTATERIRVGESCLVLWRSV